MDENKIFLLLQIVGALRQAVESLEAGYTGQDKEKFDSAKAIILDANKKIDYVLKEVQ
jgi:hypothetical protein